MNSNIIQLEAIFKQTSLNSPSIYDQEAKKNADQGTTLNQLIGVGDKVENLVLQDKTKLLINCILNVGDKVVILKERQSKLNISFFKSKANIIKYNKSNIKVEIQNGVTYIKPQKPNKIITNNFEFLIGRKTNKNIYADNGELLVKKQTKINTNIIDVVCRNGKLKELTANSVQ